MPKDKPIQREIELRGVRVNNLKNLELAIPHDQWLAICGLSGSGKSSLALDTLFAEGQRRYIESFPAYTRQFLDRIERPQADFIQGIPPAVAMRGDLKRWGRRATVGSTTEIVNSLRLVLSRIGNVMCPNCQQTVFRDSIESTVQYLQQLPHGLRFQIGFPIPVDSADTWSHWQSLGFARAIVAGKTLEMVSLAQPDNSPEVLSDPAIVVDRLSSDRLDPKRLADSIETAWRYGRETCYVWLADNIVRDRPAHSQEIDDRAWTRVRFSPDYYCDRCQLQLPSPELDHLNDASPIGACPRCEGYGSIGFYDWARIVPNPKLTLREGAIAPWNSPSYRHEWEEMVALAEGQKLPLDLPFEQLTVAHKNLLWNGVPAKKFGGLQGFFDWLDKRKYKLHLRVFASRYRSYRTCPDCDGRKLNPIGLSLCLDNQNWANLVNMQIDGLSEFLCSQSWTTEQQALIAAPLADLLARLDYLCQMGLNYLNLDRAMHSLSMGESQRVSLTTALGSRLVHLLYVLDEPSRGLHNHDIERLVRILKTLHDRGNTLVVVDNHPTLIESSDRVIELGPEAGELGGQIVFDGTAKAIKKHKPSPTGRLLRGEHFFTNPNARREPFKRCLRLQGATGHHLKDIDVEFPLGCFCIVTGVSGSGKSSLIEHTLYPALQQQLKPPGTIGLPFRNLSGSEGFQDCLLVDQTPIGRSSRSNPVTYIGVFDEIRQALAASEDAKQAGLSAGQFSFNISGGRCEKCEGTGQLEVDMHFLADVHFRCDQCRGLRFRDEVLKAKYRGKNIAEILELTCDEAFRFFRGQKKVQLGLKSLMDVGLGYLRLGQSAATLSGGESQRLKLAAELQRSASNRTLFLLVEPSAGLHAQDILKLHDCCESLLAAGHSLIIIEHNVQMMLQADWIIDMGPGADRAGGTIVACGPPEKIAQCDQSITGKYLKPYL